MPINTQIYAAELLWRCTILQSPSIIDKKGVMGTDTGATTQLANCSGTISAIQIRTGEQQRPLLSPLASPPQPLSRTLQGRVKIRLPTTVGDWGEIARQMVGIKSR